MNKSKNQGTEMFYLVHKEGEYHGFLTTCPQMAYEVRKGADSNTYFGDGTPCPAAVKFCEEQDLNANYEITEFPLRKLNVGLIVSDLKEVASGLVCDYKTPLTKIHKVEKKMSKQHITVDTIIGLLERNKDVINAQLEVAGESASVELDVNVKPRLPLVQAEQVTAVFHLYHKHGHWLLS